VKQAVIARALAFRRRAPGLFAQGTYVPLKTEGKMADHALAFARVHEGRAAVTIVTRLAARLEGVQETPLAAGSAWQGTAIVLPRNLHARRLHDVLGGPGCTEASGRLLIAGLLARLPVALLEVL
jgi:(1->4)-alpha-D-glucan 1-alpha-D-glucosylmutase